MIMKAKGVFSKFSKLLYDMYANQDKLSVFRQFRLGEYCFDKIHMDWIVLYEGHELIGHGVMCCINWDGSIDDLPTGWSDSTCRSNNIGNKNTNVALFARVQHNYRRMGYAGKLIELMKTLSLNNNKKLIIPLRPPLRYKEEYAKISFSDFSNLARDDGKPLDPWIRLHCNIGAIRISISEYSHQHVMNINDYCKYFPDVELDESEYHLVTINNELYNSYVDLKHNIAVINQGCVWVQHC